jgi:integrase
MPTPKHSAARLLGIAPWQERRADRFLTRGSPKSATSRRTVPLMPELVQALREHRPAGVPGVELVFPTELGGVLAHGNMAQRAFGSAQRRAGLVDEAGKPLYSVHALRHFAASMFIATGWPPKRVQQLLGHATLAMTTDTYTDLWPNPEDDQERLAAAQRLMKAD